MAIGHHTLNEGASELRATRAFKLDVLAGLSSLHKSVPCKWLYDAQGSRIISAIMDLEEYYLTRCEAEIFELHKQALLDAVGPRAFDLVDLGAGDGRKTAILIDHFARGGADFEFASIDISVSASRELASTLGERFPSLRGTTLIGEYATGLAWLAQRSARRKLVLFLGSNIGNFAPGEARAFLRELWLALSPGDLVLIGFDLRKDVERMRLAYDDSRGVTAAFNLNLLARINRELGGDFDLDRFRFHCGWEPRSGAIESYLISTCDQDVTIGGLGRTFHFEAWEALHTESSRKYAPSAIDELARSCGFEIAATYFDRYRWFVDALFEVIKTPGPRPIRRPARVVELE